MESKTPFKYYLADRRDYVIKDKQNQVIRAQFSLPGHSLGNLSVTMIEQVGKIDDIYIEKNVKNIISKWSILTTAENIVEEREVLAVCEIILRQCTSVDYPILK